MTETVGKCEADDNNPLCGSQNKSAKSTFDTASYHRKILIFETMLTYDQGTGATSVDRE